MNSLLEKLLQVALSDDLCKKIETTMLERIRVNFLLIFFKNYT